MLKLEIFDAQMCCSTGICGSGHDPTLVTFASDLEWLKAKGIEVVRHGLSFEPSEFVKNEAVKCLLNKEGNKGLPILVIDGEIVSKGTFPSREKLANICNIEFDTQEAPPIHREENCCCGVDCDCSTVNLPEAISASMKCECKDGAKNDNCICGEGCGGAKDDEGEEKES